MGGGKKYLNLRGMNPGQSTGQVQRAIAGMSVGTVTVDAVTGEAQHAVLSMARSAGWTAYAASKGTQEYIITLTKGK